ncbi:hypothetical protein, partial [Caldivirga sp.]|uniref:hypothetical protein n=1 Tax=Caldivirga sp. TaxID=2080243 RepID=UPI003D0B6E88
IEVRNRGERCLEGRVYVNDYIVDGVWADYIAAAVKWLLRHYGTGVHEEDHAFKWLRAYVEDKLRLLPGIIEERIRRIIK